MKLIDFLDKAVSGEDLPPKIILNGTELFLCEDKLNYQAHDETHYCEPFLTDFIDDFSVLQLEVEVPTETASMHWKEVNGDFLTPGGETLYECSECGHEEVFGVENGPRLKQCPGCKRYEEK